MAVRIKCWFRSRDQHPIRLLIEDDRGNCHRIKLHWGEASRLIEEVKLALHSRKVRFDAVGDRHHA